MEKIEFEMMLLMMIVVMMVVMTMMMMLLLLLVDSLVVLVMFQEQSFNLKEYFIKERVWGKIKEKCNMK